MNKRILAAVLAVCFLVVQVIGSVVAFEIEHVHHDHHGHGHEFADVHVSSGSHVESHHHHDRGHDKDDQPEDDQPQDDSPASPHSHVLSVSSAFAFTVQAFFAFDPGHDAPKGKFRTENEICPDGPSFEVTKPPQLV